MYVKVLTLLNRTKLDVPKLDLFDQTVLLFSPSENFLAGGDRTNVNPYHRKEVKNEETITPY